MDKDKYKVQRYDPKTDLGRLVKDASGIDVALIILQGPYGEDGTVQGLLELLGIPYQGSGVLGSALAMNKTVTKKLYENARLPVPSYIIYDRNDNVNVEACVKQLGLPLVVKPMSGGSSMGMSIVRSTADLQNSLDKAFAYDSAVMAEAYIAGIELTAGSSETRI